MRKGAFIQNKLSMVEDVSCRVTHPLLTLRINSDPAVAVPASPDAGLLRYIDCASELALWQATRRASPGESRVWNNLGGALQVRRARAGPRVLRARVDARPPRNFARANLDAPKLLR